MNQGKRRYRVRKWVIIYPPSLLIILCIYLLLPSGKNGRSEDQVPVPVLTKEENKALRRYGNEYHLKAAKSKGLKTPLSSNKEAKSDADAFADRYGLEAITDHKYYEIPLLTSSLPYLKPNGKRFLKLLGERFCDRLEEMDMIDYRFSVTSILRTLEDQKTLRKSNINATPNSSSHCYGLTFDISQTRFFERGISTPVYSYRLRNILLRELIEMQNEGLCYVLLESQTKCIHVTVR